MVSSKMFSLSLENWTWAEASRDLAALSFCRSSSLVDEAGVEQPDLILKQVDFLIDHWPIFQNLMSIITSAIDL